MFIPLISGGSLLSSSLPSLISEGGGLVCESVGKADLLSDHFESKQSREAVDLPLTYHLSPCKSKGKVFYGQEPPSGESTTTECGFNYQLHAVIY